MSERGSSPNTVVPISAYRYDKGIVKPSDIPVAAEVPYTLFVNDNEILSIATLPVHLKELCVGFLVSEAVLTRPEELADCTIDNANKVIIVELDVPEQRIEKVKRKGMLTSGCAGGMVFSVETAANPGMQSGATLKLSGSSIIGRMHELDTYQGIYRTTKGVHGAAVASRDETLVILEDLGRHNAVDKIVGHCFLNRMRTDDKLLLTTGRVTSEVLSKASRGGFRIIVSRSSASSMAIRLAQQCSIDVVTYVRASRFNYFSNGGVILIDDGA